MLKPWSPCNCRKSRCLKLYCECFAASIYCDPEKCRCVGCHNLSEYDAERKRAIDHILSRRPDAFRSKIQETSGGRVKHLQGCKCSRSRCLKKYCECFQAGIFCQSHCRCKRCENFSGSKALQETRGTQVKQPPASRRGSAVTSTAPGYGRARRDSAHFSGSDTPSEGDQPPAKRARVRAPPKTTNRAKPLGRSQSAHENKAASRRAFAYSSAAPGVIPAERIPEDDIVEAAGRMLTALSQPSAPARTHGVPRQLSAVGAPQDPIFGSEPHRGSESCPAALPEDARLSAQGGSRAESSPGAPASSAGDRSDRFGSESGSGSQALSQQPPVAVGSTTPSKSRRKHSDILSPRTERAYIVEVVRALQTMSEQVGGAEDGSNVPPPPPPGSTKSGIAPPAASHGVGEVTPLVPAATAGDANGGTEDLPSSKCTAFRKGIGENAHAQPPFRGPSFFPTSQSTEQMDMEGDHSRVSLNSVHEDNANPVARQNSLGAE